MLVSAGAYKTTAWSARPLQLADGAMCCPSGLARLQFGFMGQLSYHHFAVIQNLSTLLVLGMGFMIRSSVMIWVPSRTVVLGDVPGGDLMMPSHSVLGLKSSSFSLATTVDEATLSDGKKLNLLSC